MHVTLTRIDGSDSYRKGAVPPPQSLSEPIPVPSTNHGRAGRGYKLSFRSAVDVLLWYQRTLKFRDRVTGDPSVVVTFPTLPLSLLLLPAYKRLLRGMLKHAVKLTWAILCSIGTMATWPVLYALAKVTGCWWIPMTFGSALTLLIFSFDLGQSARISLVLKRIPELSREGLIWNLNPYEFPIGFCLAQMFLVNITSFILCGVVAAWYFSALSAAVWPSQTKRYVYTVLLRYVIAV